MSNSLSYMGYSVCEIAASNAFGRTAVGGAELCMSVRFSLSAYGDEVIEIEGVTARFCLSFRSQSTSLLICNAVPERPIFIKNRPAQDPLAWVFSGMISEAQLAEIEVLRKGQDFGLHVHVAAVGRGRQGTLPMSAESNIPINVSTWAEIAPQLGGLSYVVFALPVPTLDGHDLRHVQKLLSDARRALHDARFDAVVALCRQALESYRKICPADDVGYAAVDLYKSPQRKTMTKRQRLGLVEESVRHLSHLAVHTDETGAPESFSRSDAVLALTTTIGLLATATESKLQIEQK